MSHLLKFIPLITSFRPVWAISCTTFWSYYCYNTRW